LPIPAARFIKHCTFQVLTAFNVVRRTTVPTGQRSGSDHGDKRYHCAQLLNTHVPRNIEFTLLKFQTF
jgi:hypothetical protein